MDVAIAGRADAAGIDDQAAVPKPNRTGDMAVTTENKPLRNSLSG